MQIQAMNLSKRYGRSLVVDDVTFTVGEGRVTGFLGPNGAGKSTTMRMLLGLHHPDTGAVLYDGRPLRSSSAPLRVVGGLLDAGAFDQRGTPLQHLRAQAATHGIGRKRVDEVIALTGLTKVADKRIGSFSLGMGQRLGIANAILADPQTLILDEPINGLDAEGVRWVRTTLREFAAEGRSVLVSSHLMGEMAQTADHVIVIGKGKVLADAPVAEVIDGTAGQAAVRVRTEQLDLLIQCVPSAGVSAERIDATSALLRGIDVAGIGRIAAANAIVLLELTPQEASLEEAYLDITADAVEYRTGATA
ncbi:MAG: ATP-binding cassette domain-containing protein [Microbacterium sp.]